MNVRLLDHSDIGTRGRFTQSAIIRNLYAQLIVNNMKSVFK